MTEDKLYARTPIDLEKEKKERKFNRELSKRRKELDELAFLRTYQTKMETLIRFMQMDMEGGLTLTEVWMMRNALLRAMRNNLELKSNSESFIKYEEAEAIAEFYRYHDYNHGELSSHDEPFILKKIRESRKKNLHSFTLQDYNFLDF